MIAHSRRNLRTVLILVHYLRLFHEMRCTSSVEDQANAVLRVLVGQNPP
jgi:hypothetical protein